MAWCFDFTLKPFLLMTQPANQTTSKVIRKYSSLCFFPRLSLNHRHTRYNSFITVYFSLKKKIFYPPSYLKRFFKRPLVTSNILWLLINTYSTDILWIINDLLNIVFVINYYYLCHMFLPLYCTSKQETFYGFKFFFQWLWKPFEQFYSSQKQTVSCWIWLYFIFHFEIEF